MTLRSLFGMTCCLCLFGASAQYVKAAPPADSRSDEAYQPERMQDPYLPGQGQSESGLRSIGRTPPGSVQVNVDAGGNNIVGDAANEPSLVIDPTNSLHMAITWRQFDTVSSNFRQGGYGYSTDGGASWTFPGKIEPGVFNSDPVLGADNAGRFFWASLHSDLCMNVWQSTNAGQTWPTGIAAFGGDKEWLAVDRTGGVGDGNIYVGWQTQRCPGNPNSNQFTRSTNHGASWSTPIALPSNPVFGVTAVGPDGAVYVAGTTGVTSTFVVSKSTSAQNPALTPTFSSVSGSFLGGSQVINAGPNPGGLLGQVWIAANPANASHVFLLCSVGSTSSSPTNVRFAKSTNGGTTWGASVKVNDDSVAGKWHWFGTMSVAPNGRIDVVWNDTRDDPGNALSRLYYSYSNDEGTTWAPNVALTPQWNSQVGFPNQNKIGDYYHMISDNAGASLAYAATFNGEQDVYYMRITNCVSPIVNPIGRANATCGVAFTSPAPSTSAGTAPITWSLGAGAPAGMTINSGTGAVSWPSPTTTGSPFSITTVATNSCGNGTQSWPLTVNPNPPTISANNAFAVCGTAYTSAAPSSGGGVPPLTWTLLSGPSGMTIDASTGVVNWPNPLATGSPFTVSVQAASAGDCGSNSTNWQLGVVLGDFDGDGLVTETDIDAFVNDLLLDPPAQICAGDLNGDGLVDGNDIPAFDAALGV